MALINLPTTPDSHWDTAKLMEDQTEEALAYYSEQVATQTEVIDDEEAVGNPPSAQNRWKKKHFDDVANGLRIIQERAYVHLPTHRASGAVKRHSGSIETIA